jgi:hypothetical protein
MDVVDDEEEERADLSNSSVLVECLLKDVMQVLEPPLPLRGCIISSEGSQLSFIIHDLVQHIGTAWEEALTEFNWYKYSACN